MSTEAGYSGDFNVEVAFRRKGTFRQSFLGRLLRARGAGPGLCVLVLVIITALIPSVLAPYDPTHIDASNVLRVPSLAHPFGTDALGRDVFSRVIFGARISLLVGCIAVIIAAAVGIPVGIAAGYLGGAPDFVLMRIMDGLIAFPPLILALALIAVLGSSLTNVMIAVGVATVPTYARVARAEVLGLKSRDFVTAAEVLGAGPWRIVALHILPSAAAPLLVIATFGFAGAILAEASLSFLGLGVRPPTPTWGNLLFDGFQYLRAKPYLAIAPGTSIFVVVLSVNFVGDGLRDVLDPRLRGVAE